jgi:hypothetical protein
MNSEFRKDTVATSAAGLKEKRATPSVAGSAVDLIEAKTSAAAKSLRFCVGPHLIGRRQEFVS